MNNSRYGGFVVSKNILNGQRVRYSYRTESSIPQLNGWTLLSEIDDDAYVNNSSNFEIVNADTILKYAPQIMMIFEAPYGTDLFWVYGEETHTLIGFYDLNKRCSVSVHDIVAGSDENKEDKENEHE